MNNQKNASPTSRFKNIFSASRGFTIIEMVVTLAIIAILILIAVPSFTKYIDSAEDTKTDVYAGAINTAVIQTLFPYNNETVSNYEDLNNDDGNDTSSPERDRILRLADLPDGDTINFQYYDRNDVPKLSTFTYPSSITDNTWIVYLPVNDITTIADAKFDFTLDVLVFTPRYTTLEKFANSISVVD